MRSMWLVAKHEYLKRVGKRSFLLGTLGIPLVMVAAMAFGALAAVSSESRQPLGYVDRSGLLSDPILPPTAEDWVEMRPFPTEEDARAALELEEIQAFYVIPSDYLETRQIEVYYWEEEPGSSAQGDFVMFLRTNLAASLPESVRSRVIEGSDLTIRSMDGDREFDASNPLSFLLPFMSGFLFVFTVLLSSGYLLQVVVDEKESRTVEILITSLTPEQLIGGKALGLMAVTFTQILVWVITILLIIGIGGQFFAPLQEVRISGMFILVMALFFVPSFALMGGVMTAIGGAVAETRQGQQIAGFLNLFFMLPYFLIALILANPDSPLIVGMTLFPTTAFVTISVRWSMTLIPLWQLAASWLLLTTTAVLSIWASARIFRTGMLMYGKALNLRGALSALRTK